MEFVDVNAIMESIDYAILITNYALYRILYVFVHHCVLVASSTFAKFDLLACLQSVIYVICIHIHVS